MLQLLEGLVEIIVHTWMVFGTYIHTIGSFATNLKNWPPDSPYLPGPQDLPWPQDPPEPPEPPQSPDPPGLQDPIEFISK